MAEINLMSKYPKSKRNVTKRATKKSTEDCHIARQFGKQYFDGKRSQGYGGYEYNPIYWSGVVQDMIHYYKLTKESKILDVGCAKGFMLYEFKKALPGISVTGIDISRYAIENSINGIDHISIANAKDLSQFKDEQFDLVISINTVHNLNYEDCEKAIREINRVGKKAYIIVDAWRNEKEHKNMRDWNLTANTYMHVNDWKDLFLQNDYHKDFYWFIAGIDYADMDHKYSYCDSVPDKIEKYSNINSVLVIGDTIIDKYTFVAPKGRAIKDPILSTEFISQEIYAGGAIAVANHVSSFAKEVKLVTMIGEKEGYNEFIRKSLAKNISITSFKKPDARTIVKERIIDYYRNNKLFKIEYMDDWPISNKLSKEIVDYLDNELPKYDLVIVADYGHGFINDQIRTSLGLHSKFLSVNAQSNSANMGFNHFSNYIKPTMVVLNESELRLTVRNRFEDIHNLIINSLDFFDIKHLLVTLGRKGCIYATKENIIECPAFTTDVKDTVGAGDALFAISSIFCCNKAPDEVIPFVGNSAGALAANIMGNKKPVNKEQLLEFIKNSKR